MFLSVPGDVDGDGMPDVYVSDWNNSANGPSTGRVYVHSGRMFIVLSGVSAVMLAPARGGRLQSEPRVRYAGGGASTSDNRDSVTQPMRH